MGLAAMPTLFSGIGGVPTSGAMGSVPYGLFPTPAGTGAIALISQVCGILVTSNAPKQPTKKNKVDYVGSVG